MLKVTIPIDGYQSLTNWSGEIQLFDCDKNYLILEANLNDLFDGNLALDLLEPGSEKSIVSHSYLTTRLEKITKVFKVWTKDLNFINILD